MNIISTWNSNTFSNLNTVTNLLPIEFKISYDEIGNISWYKDDILISTDTSVLSSSYTTNWSSYGMKTIKVQSTNISGTSLLTIFIVEVVKTGTATIVEATTYPDPRINGYYTYNITNGWSNIPSLYLFSKKDIWIEYVQAKTYIIKVNILVVGATFYIDSRTVNELKLRALPVLLQSQIVNIWVSQNGTMNIDNVIIKGWDIQNNKDITIDNASPVIKSELTNTLNVTNCVLEHIYLYYSNDKNLNGELIDNNTFFEGNPFNINYAGSERQTISNNIISRASVCNVFCDNNKYSYTTLKNNKIHGPIGYQKFGDNVLVGFRSKVIGNEITYSGWNLIEFTREGFSRDNILHDSGGNHNGYNRGDNDRYMINDHCYNFPAFSGFYIQLEDVRPIKYPHRNYLINCKATNVPVGFNFFGGYDSYIYNFICKESCANVQYGSNNIFIRKTQFLSPFSTRPNNPAFRVVDYMPETYGYVENITLIDTIFADTYATDLSIYPQGKAVLNVINSYHITSQYTTQKPTTYFYTGYPDFGAEIRFYVWLDILVKDILGNPIKDVNITIQNITDINYPNLDVSLPPPPPDLQDFPSTPLPRPSLSNSSNYITNSYGKISVPNYGWSTNSESSPALLFSKQNKTGIFSNYKYKIIATYINYEVSTIVIPDETWYRQNPVVPTKTTEIIIDISNPPEQLNVVSTTPLNNSINIDVYDTIIITFNKNIQTGINYNNIILKDLNNNTINISKNINNNVLNITPTNALNYNTIYNINIPTDAVEDLFGSILLNEYVLKFTTIINSPSESTIAYWKFDEGTGTTIHDSSIYNNTGSIIGATWTTGIKGTSALQFNGISQYVNIPYSSSLEINNNFTISTWIYHTSSTGYNDIIITKDNIFHFNINEYNKLSFYGNGLTPNTTTTIDSIPYNTWIHVAVTYNGTYINLYINGISKNKSNVSGALILGTQPTKISNNDSSCFNGIIDEIHIYNRELTNNEIINEINIVNNCPIPICNITITQI